MEENNTEQTASQTADSMSREEFEAELKTNQSLPPEDIAAAFFKLEYPRFKAMLDVLSRNELERLCLNLVGGALVPVQNQLKSDKEKTTYYLGAQMAENLVIMRLALEMKRAEEAERLLAEKENNKEETKTETQGEQNV